MNTWPSILQPATLPVMGLLPVVGSQNRLSVRGQTVRRPNEVLRGLRSSLRVTPLVVTSDKSTSTILLAEKATTVCPTVMVETTWFRSNRKDKETLFRSLSTDVLSSFSVNWLR